jgi:hypothetical protein
MTKLNTGKHGTKWEDMIEQRNLMNLKTFTQAISVGLAFCLTIYLSCREQYFDSLLSLTLTIIAATSHRLKKIQIGIKGLETEWRDPRK